MDEYDVYKRDLKKLMTLCPECDITIDWHTALCVIGALHLALRHPNMPALTGATVRGLLIGLIDEIGTVVPELAKILRKGDDPSCDVD